MERNLGCAGKMPAPDYHESKCSLAVPREEIPWRALHYNRARRGAMNSVGIGSVPATQSPNQKGRLSVLRRITASYKLPLSLSLLLLVATLGLYYPVVHHPFANLDDRGYVYGNPHVQDGLTWTTVKWAFTSFGPVTPEVPDWHPLTWLSHALDCQMFDVDPAGHHAVNIVWHSLDAVTLFWVLLLATGYWGRSFMVAALFALHPINVESVAWIAERKTLLATFFFLLALGAYRWYARQPGALRYGVVAVLFVLGLMSKAQIITLPFVLLLWDYWPLRRMFAAGTPSTEADAMPAFPPRSFFYLIEEKIPLFMLCAASAWITMREHSFGPPPQSGYSIWIRLGNATVAYVRYVEKALWPSHLAVLYLHPANTLRLRQIAAAALVLLAITAFVIVGRRFRYLPVGWFWFLGTLVPMIGLIQVGWHAMADRYAYQSFIGLFILVCWGVSDWVRQERLPKALLPAVSVAVLLLLATVTHRQIGYWSDDLTLWSHVLDVSKGNWVAESMVGSILQKQGDREDAMRHFRAALAIYPMDWRSNFSIAVDEQQRGNLPEALRRYKLAVDNMESPLQRAEAYQNMAIVYRDLGDLTDAMDYRHKAEQLTTASPGR